MKLIKVDGYDEDHVRVLYEILQERTPEQSISHMRLPPWEKHVDFVRRDNGYDAWYLIIVDMFDGRTTEPAIIGNIYLTKHNEIGIFIRRKYQKEGYGKEALIKMLELHPREYYLANVNPNNEPSRKFFEKMGGKLIQVTYRISGESWK